MVRNYKRKTEDRWSKEDLLEALICIKEAKLKINDAARQYGISRATLYRQYQKFILAGGKCDVNQFRTCGGNPILTKVEEDVLEKTIRDLREQGFTVTSSDIKRICFEYCDSNGIPNQFNQEKRMASDDWYYGFLKRHPDVRIPKSGNGQNRTNRSSSENSAAVELDGNMTMEAILVAAASAPEKPIKTKKLKSSPSKKLGKQEIQNSSKAPIHIIPTISNSSVTVVTSDEQMFQQQLDTIMSSGNRGKKQQHQHPASNHVPSSPGKEANVKKPLKRLSGGIPNNKARGRKNLGNSAQQLHSIPVTAEDEYVKEEMGEHEEVEEDGEEHEQVLGLEMEQDEVMETEEGDEEEEEDDDEEDDEEEDEEEEVEAGEEPVVEGESQEEEQEDVEMAEEDEEEQDEAEKSESEEEEEGEEDDAENDEEEEGEDQEEVEEQEDGEEDAENDADNDAEEGEAEEGEGEEDEEEEEDEDEDEEEEENDEDTKGENDESGSDVDCTNDDELLEKLLDM